MGKINVAAFIKFVCIASAIATDSRVIVNCYVYCFQNLRLLGATAIEDKLQDVRSC